MEGAGGRRDGRGRLEEGDPGGRIGRVGSPRHTVPKRISAAVSWETARPVGLHYTLLTACVPQLNPIFVHKDRKTTEIQPPSVKGNTHKRAAPLTMSCPTAPPVPPTTPLPPQPPLPPTSTAPLL